MSDGSSSLQRREDASGAESVEPPSSCGPLLGRSAR